MHKKKFPTNIFLIPDSSGEEKNKNILITSLIANLANQLNLLVDPGWHFKNGFS